ncbi:MAG: T9SS type A sorting domain-containing protein [Bacteroidetes bacterium]|nr:T9SS type A sorting domain-containing protein [Bacteroidota bacterium]
MLFCFVLFCFVFNHKAQNLVPNSSFEQGIDCSNGQLSNAIGWESTNNGVGICVHLQACQSDAWVRTPRQYLSNCFQSYQTVRTGVAYGEFGIYTQDNINQESKHPSIKLLDTLDAGKIYCVTYHVSMWNNARYSMDKLGALFTPTPFPYYTSSATLSVQIVGQYTPQVVSTSGVVFEDTLGWEEVSGSFTAVGNEAYLTLGDFFLHSQHLIKDSYPTNCNTLAEYYIDDVSVEVVEIAKAKNDTLIYQGDSVLVGANNSEAALFNWQPTAGLSCTNCPNPKASPTVNTTYTVTKTQCKAVTSDVITVSVSPTGINEMNINNAITLQPNPSNGLISINSRYQMQKVEVINIAGQLLLSETATEKTHQLQLQSFAEGIYFVRIIYPNGLSIVKKVIVNH